MWNFLKSLRKRFRHFRPPFSFKPRINPDGTETFKVVTEKEKQEDVVSVFSEAHGSDPDESGNAPPSAHTAVFIEDKPGYKGRVARRTYGSVDYRDSPPM